jgi:predicted ArsR family transcriptional regulator
MHTYTIGKRNDVVMAIREKKRVTSAEIGVETAYLDALKQAGIVEVIDRIPTGGRGRPRNLYRLSKRGQGIALNLTRKAQKVSQPRAEQELIAA